MSALEDENTIQPWRQANRFTLTMRGHWSGIPEGSNTVALSNYDPFALDTVTPLIREIASDGNYNTIYESFYAPLDFQLSAIAFKLPNFLPKGIAYKIKMRINGSQVDLIDIPEDEDHNQKQLNIECSSIIYEDDFIELEVVFNGNVDLLSFNANNVVFSISGCAWYGMYKAIYADLEATVATTENIILSGVQVIDGFNVIDDDVVLVKDQTNLSENGLWVVSLSDWVRYEDYVSDQTIGEMGSLYDLVIFVTNGDTQNSTDTTNYVFTESGAGASEIPLIDWNEGDSWYKGNIHLQNRSGNEILTDRVIIDTVKATHNFLIQGVSLSVFNDPLTVVKKLKDTTYCFYLDILVNGRSILPSIGFPRPISLDSSENLVQNYDMDVFNDTEGYPVRFGDVVSLKLYQKNPYIRINGKIIQAILYGCGPDCATLDNPLVSVYEPCEDTPCEWKYTSTNECDPETAKAKRKDPAVLQTTPSLPVDRDYITVDSIYVTINGQRIWL